METATDDRVLTLERVFKASPEALFDAWTKPEILASWWGPEGMTCPIYELDVRPGGRWETTMVNADGEKFTCSGTYKLVERPHRLAFTWGWRQPDGSRGHETLIEIRFEAVEGGTRQTLVQQTFENGQECDRHAIGWTSSFNDLDKLFG